MEVLSLVIIVLIFVNISVFTDNIIIANTSWIGNRQCTLLWPLFKEINSNYSGWNQRDMHMMLSPSLYHACPSARYPGVVLRHTPKTSHCHFFKEIHSNYFARNQRDMHMMLSPGLYHACPSAYYPGVVLRQT